MMLLSSPPSDASRLVPSVSSPLASGNRLSFSSDRASSIPWSSFFLNFVFPFHPAVSAGIHSPNHITYSSKMSNLCF